ncbi:hypothetical protein N9C83_04170 [Opitutales bacterium]|nr:hypothetical protein [Opitutales bacterium]
MGWLSIRTSNHTHVASRGQLRKQLRKAARGNTQAFEVVSDQYLNLITEFLVISGYHEEDRIQGYCREVLHNIWLRSAYIRRVSDFERQLFIFLKQIPINVAPFQDLLTQRLVMLNSMQRFLLVGRDLESWSTKNLSLATRVPKYELRKPLYDAWKTLVGFRLSDLDFNTNECMEKVVENMEGALDHTQQRRLCKKVKENAMASEFKADCLNLRCELVELRQNARWDRDTRVHFFEDLREDIATIVQLKPELGERLKNQVSFQCLHLETHGS